MSTEIDFAELHIPRVTTDLWLPRKTVVDWEYNDAMSRTLLDLAPPMGVVHHDMEQPSYSNYHLYEVEVKINPAVS
jgi:hypothetical protein